MIKVKQLCHEVKISIFYYTWEALFEGLLKRLLE